MREKSVSSYALHAKEAPQAATDTNTTHRIREKVRHWRWSLQ